MKQRGFTLIETMVSLAIFSIVSIVMVSTFLVGYKTITAEARIIAADTAVSEASLSLVRDLNSADALPAGTVIINSGSSVALTYDAGADTVVYIVDANKNLIRTVNGSAQVAARGVTSVIIATAGCYVTVTIQPSATGAGTSTLNVSNRPAGCF
jgi:prepilin-type N-terminal cleavage/methylation domain-containing protein